MHARWTVTIDHSDIVVKTAAQIFSSWPRRLASSLNITKRHCVVTAMYHEAEYGPISCPAPKVVWPNTAMIGGHRNEFGLRLHSTDLASLTSALGVAARFMSSRRPPRRAETGWQPRRPTRSLKRSPGRRDRSGQNLRDYRAMNGVPHQLNR
jgi:hypothetical protein